MWRLEIEYHGWAGLTWIKYPHYSIPLGVIFFLTWVNFQVKPINTYKRIRINLIALIFVYLVFTLIKISLFYNNVGGSSALGFMMLPNWLIIFILFSYLLLLPLLSVGTYSILRIFSIQIRTRYLLYSIVCIYSSIPVSLFITRYIFPYERNLIHAIKTGVIIPFITFSVGILFLGEFGFRKPLKANDTIDELSEN